MNQWKVILATLLIFCSGLGTGVLLNSRKPLSATDKPIINQPLNSKLTQQPVFFRSTGFLQNHLDLSGEQNKQIQEIMARSREQIRDESASFREKLISEHKIWEKAVREVLTPSQTSKFDRLPKAHFRNESGRPSGRPNPNSNTPYPSSILPASTNSPQKTPPLKHRPKNKQSGKSIG